MTTPSEQVQSEQRQKPTPFTPPPQPQPSHPEKSPKGSTEEQGRLPPPRDKKGLRTVPPPLANTSLNHFIYALFTITVLITAYYSYRLVQYNTEEAGGWWNLVLGRNPSTVQQHSTTGGSGSVEDVLNQLAQALGVSPEELARFIASAVRGHVSPASLSSIAAKETGRVVKAFLENVGQGRGRE